MSRILKKQAVASDVYSLALERIRHIYDLYDHIAVSFSGGKDSTVCLNLALQIARERGRLPLDVFFYDEEAIPYQTEEYVRRVCSDPDIELRWLCLPVKHRNACSRKSPFWYPWDPDCEPLWTRALPAEAIQTLAGFRKGLEIPNLNGLLFAPERQGTIGVIMGIRAQESMTRQRAVTAKSQENYLIKDEGEMVKGGIYKAYPIYDWQTEDVWTAPRQFGWDYNRAYDVMDQAGITPSIQRCAPPFGEQPMRGLWMFRVCFPELWEKMWNRVPGASTAVRYATTELYAFGALPEKPDHLSWPDFLLYWINKMEGYGRRAAAKQINRFMREHYAKTNDPILVHTPHPVTGVGWNKLLLIAMRGDFKERATMQYFSEKDNRWEKYRQELHASQSHT